MLRSKSSVMHFANIAKTSLIVSAIYLTFWAVRILPTVQNKQHFCWLSLLSHRNEQRRGRSRQTVSCARAIDTTVQSAVPCARRGAGSKLGACAVLERCVAHARWHGDDPSGRWTTEFVITPFVMISRTCTKDHIRTWSQTNNNITLRCLFQ